MFKEYLDLKNIVDKNILVYMPEIPKMSKILEESMEYSLLAGGKRLRPILVLASSRLTGASIEEALPFAISYEYIHTYSLIHDDLPEMDDDDYRRGKLTNHIVFGDDIALLAGDGLLNSSFEIMIKSVSKTLDNFDLTKRKIRAMNVAIASAGVRGMISGQVSDMEEDLIVGFQDTCEENSREDLALGQIEVEKSKHKKEILEKLDFTQKYKTGALITGAILSGLYLGEDVSEKLIEDMRKYGEAIGKAFQVADDILDEKSTLEELGKNVKKDREQNKATYTTLYGVERAEEELETLTEKALDSISHYGKEVEFFRKLALYLKMRTY